MHPFAHSSEENDPSSCAPRGALWTPTLHAAGKPRFRPTRDANRIAGNRLLFLSVALTPEAPLPETVRVPRAHASTQRSSGHSSAALCDSQRSRAANFSWQPSFASSLPSRRGLYSNRPNWQAEPPHLVWLLFVPSVTPVANPVFSCFDASFRPAFKLSKFITVFSTSEYVPRVSPR